jgi:hypothetical protein
MVKSALGQPDHRRPGLLSRDASRSRLAAGFEDGSRAGDYSRWVRVRICPHLAPGDETTSRPGDRGFAIIAEDFSLCDSLDAAQAASIDQNRPNFPVIADSIVNFPVID